MAIQRSGMSSVTPIEDTRPDTSNIFSIELGGNRDQSHFQRANARSGIGASLSGLDQSQGFSGGGTRLVFNPDQGTMRLDFDMVSLEDLFASGGPQATEKPAPTENPAENRASEKHTEESSGLQDLVKELLTKMLLAGFGGGGGGAGATTSSAARG